jgi:regulator of sirC expression with transglutaminase-like and TPR domain
MPLSSEFRTVLAREPIDLPRAALVIAKLEYPNLDPGRSLTALEELGARAASRLAAHEHAPLRNRIAELNRLFFDEENFAGNRAHYDDYRNSLLNVVLERRLGIPISLALVYMEVARLAGLDVRGVSFPGHFLLRVSGEAAGDDGAAETVFLDPFNRGAEVDELGCRALLARQAGDDAPFDGQLLEPCTARQLLARMLNNLKRTYIEQRSFSQARDVTDLLLAIDPTLHAERRDRGLLAYHLDDFPAALHDLEDYLRLSRTAAEASDHEERDQLWEHVQTLRRRVAGLN